MPLLDRKSLTFFSALKNPHVVKIVKDCVELCRPKKVTVLTGTEEDRTYIRKLALKNAEEAQLKSAGHTVHFDGFFDQGRDKEKTKVLLPKGKIMGKHINVGERKNCLKEIFSLLNGVMKEKEMFVLFYCLGPINSRFSIPALQITDSAYIVHSENLLYRKGFEEFKKLKGSSDFFYFIHSAGELERGISKNVDKKRIYIDLKKNRVISVNSQYAGNTVGLKKLALRLAIKKASTEGWLAEHMLLLGVSSVIPGEPRSWRGKSRNLPTNQSLDDENIPPLPSLTGSVGMTKGIIYFAGAFPSACGKTSTAMIPGQTILGDDIAYIRAGKDGRAYGANVEKGIFGIIENINPNDDPLIYKVLTSRKEVIFSNVLIKNGKPYWLGMGLNLPKEGINYSGKWKEGITDRDGNEILPAHKNARYTVDIEELENADPNLHHPDGVPISGIIYGGRDSDTSPPVVESFSFKHGVFMGASLESETTAATLGQTGQRKHNPMANLDFLVIPLGTYINNHLKFGRKLKNPPVTFTTNYFLKASPSVILSRVRRGEGSSTYLNQKTDKKIWLLWMASRVKKPKTHRGCADALSRRVGIKTPIGFIPRYEDLKNLFWQIFKRKYSKADYKKQFSIRTRHLLEKLDRIEAIYRDEQNVPKELFTQNKNQRSRLQKAFEKHKKEVISPFAFYS